MPGVPRIRSIRALLALAVLAAGVGSSGSARAQGQGEGSDGVDGGAPPPTAEGPKDVPFADDPTASELPRDPEPPSHGKASAEDLASVLPDSAIPDRPLQWVPEWSYRAGTWDLVIAGAGAATALIAAVTPPSGHHRYGGILIDDDVRDALRIKSLNGRYIIRDASDVGISLLTTWPFLVDALITTWWYHGNVEVARKMAIVSAQTLTVTAALQGVTNGLASRERPYGQLCGGELPEDTVDCTRNGRYRSFYSGHASLSFAGASVICMNHVGLKILGGPFDALSCVGAYGLASATAMFRVMGDMHYFSDVTLGAAMGTLVGLGIPLLHGHKLPPNKTGIDVQIVPVGTGLGVGGVF